MSLNAVLSLLPLALPAAHLLAAGICHRFFRPALSFWLSTVGLGTALISGIAALTFGEAIQAVPLVSPAAASYLLAILVALLGLVISHFSRNYLAGDARQRHFLSMLHLTLAAVATVATTNHLFVLLAAWLGVSFALNELLLFYPNRSRAVLAAHKKFLFARTAELALLVAFFMLYQQHGTAQISVIMSAYPAPLGGAEHVAMTLIALAALIKCAQLPMHGWLIQVVESPTPVSALLHAGVVNLGGYLLILFAPLLSASAPAISLILIVAGISVVLASLIMTTRSTVKVKLAWSTVAQMGMMLVQCALGLFELAMLHLLAHACYKAYLFLRSGSAVHEHTKHRLTPSGQSGIKVWAMATAMAASGTILAAQFFAPGGPISPWLLLCAFLTVVLIESDSVSRKPLPATAISFAVMLLLVHAVQKQIMAGFMALDARSSIALVADIWVLFLTGTLITCWLYLRRDNHSARAQTIHRWLYAGLFLDEWVTRKTLQIWPLRVPIRLQVKPKRTTLWEGE